MSAKGILGNRGHHSRTADCGDVAELDQSTAE